MTTPLAPPPRKNPLARTRVALSPPAMRSRAALGMAAAAAEGAFRLQVCAACAAVQYPPRDVCGACLSPDIPWRDVANTGRVIASTTLHIPADTYFRERAPWRTGMVLMDCGPAIVAHLHGDVAEGAAVRLMEMLDTSGQPVMMALPAEDTPHMTDDRQWREFTADPRDRRVLVSDVRSEIGQVVARAMLQAGARVFAGIADEWRPFAGQSALAALPGLEIVPLDITDTNSVHRLAASLGGRVEIVVNTARHVRPGGIIGRGDVTTARDEMEIAYFGAMRLAQAFGPALKFRAADGTHPACAWVNVLSVYALASLPAYGGFSAAQAAALSLSQTLRAELRPGVRVLDVLVGPVDDEWHQPLPPPKVMPATLANAIVQALRRGVEHIAVGDVAQDVLARFQDSPATLARELSNP